MGCMGRGWFKVALEKELPLAFFYSARTGKVKKHNSKQTPPKPEVLVWAVGRSRMSYCCFPPRSWKPKVVLDLNYSDDSPGKEYAMLSKAQYISGKTMFHCQAQHQQKLYKKISHFKVS